MPLAALLMQRSEAPAAEGTPAVPPPPAPVVPGTNPEATAGALTPSGTGAAPAGKLSVQGGGFSRIVNPVQMEVIEGLDVLVLRGNEDDVQQLMAMVRLLEGFSGLTEPTIDIMMLKHVELHPNGHRGQELV